ncbi:hypothetical protein CYY_007876 [Polysphondylium violaceum]|uniref:EGF-like domain-containing protein n=1 Tax=Polysphondylium violaceum TaxID=133409 RepID=A0A8J4PP54_9MYCE|nr:hypothetical protein CYY_007876 [Polysphondylium violaceum]
MIHSYKFCLFVLFFVTLFQNCWVIDAQQAVVAPVGGIFKGVEPYATSGGFCSTILVVKGAINLPTGGIAISCIVLSAPTSPTCVLNSIFYNTTHFSAKISLSFTPSLDTYTNIVLGLTKSIDNSVVNLALVNQDQSPYTYKCFMAPPSSPIKSLAQPIQIVKQVNVYQSNFFFAHLKMNEEFTQPLPGSFTCSSSDYTCSFYYIDRQTIVMVIGFVDNFLNVDSGNVGLNYDSTLNIFSLRNPLDSAVAGITLLGYKVFKIPPLWGVFLDTTLSSNDQFPPINLNLFPLYGSSNQELRFLTRASSTTPRLISQAGQTTPFLSTISSPITTTGIIKSLVVASYGLALVEFETNSRFFFPLSNSFNNNYYSYYPYGLVSNALGKRSYRISPWIDKSATQVSFVIKVPGSNEASVAATPTIADSSPPVLVSLQVVFLNDTHSVLRVGVEDDVSGVALIRLLNIELTKKHLVSGTNLNGVYEAIITTRLSFSTEIYIFDYSGLIQYYNNQQLNFKFGDMIELSQTRSYILDDVSSLSFSVNQVDVTSNPVDVILYANVSQTLEQRLTRTSITATIVFGIFLTNPYITIVGVYNVDKQLYEFPFTVPPRLPSGALKYTIQINNHPILLDDFLFIGKFGNSAKINVINSGIVDTSCPIVTKALQLSSQTQPLTWDLEFYDISGVKNVIVGITSEYDVEGQNFTIPANGQTTLTYTLTYPLNPSTCRAMKYWISYVYTEDMMGNKGESTRNSNADFHPFYQFDDSTGDYIEVPSTYCTTVVSEVNPPGIQSMTLTKTTNSTLQNEQLLVRFKVSDDTAVSQDRLPTCFITDQDREYISVVAQPLPTSDKTIREYICPFIFPFYFGPQVHVSIYGLYDIFFNYIGYSTLDLFNLGLENNPLYFIPSTASLVIIESTSSLEIFTDQLYIYGRGYIAGSTMVEIQTDTEILTLTPSVTTGSTLLLNGIKPSSQYKVRVYIGATSSLVVKLKGQGQSSSQSSSQSSLDSSSDSSLQSSSSSMAPSCKTDCGEPLGYGVCKGTTCVCNVPHSGLDCLGTIANNTTIEPNTQNPSVNLTLQAESKFSSFISLVSLREYDNGGSDVVGTHVFNNDRWVNMNTIVNQDVKTLQYKYVINNSINTTIYATIQVFSQAKSIVFGKKTLQMNPSTVKFTFNITAYPFAKSTNSLQILMGASLLSTQEVGCSIQDFIKDQGDSQYLKIQIDQISLFGRFIGYGIVDGREESITNTLVEKVDELNQQQQSSKSQQSFIGLNIRYFTQSVLLDPDFSVLIEPRSASSDQSNSICSQSSKSKKLSAAQIAGIVIGGVVFLFIVAAIIVYLLSEKTSNPVALKLRKLAQN